MGTKGKDVGGGMPGLGKSVIAGSHGTGKYGQPLKFYDKSMAKHKGPNRQLKMVKGPDGKPVPFFAMDKKGSNDLAPRMMKDKQKISKQQDDVLAGVSKYKCRK